MSSDSTVMGRLDQLCRTGDRLLETAPSLPELARALLEASAATEEAVAGALFEFQAWDDVPILAEHQLEQLGVDGLFTLDHDHISLLAEAVRQQRSLALLDRRAPEGGLRPYSAVMMPLSGLPPRVVELFSFDLTDESALQTLRGLAEAVAGYLNRFLESAPSAPPAPADDFSVGLLTLVHQAQLSLDAKRAAAVSVNEARRLLGCDRVTLAVRYGRRVHILAISGAQTVHRRANLYRALQQLTAAVIRLGQPFTYRGTVEDLPEIIEKPLAEYLSESRMRMVRLVPLREPEPLLPDEDKHERPAATPPRRVFGCLIVEQALEARPRPHLIERTDSIAQQLEPLLHNCERYESIFLLPFWRALGRGVRWFKGRRRWAAGAVLLLLVGLGAGLALIPWTYRVEATGFALPELQYEVYAPWDGDVRAVFVDSGQSVKAGDLLVQLDNDELDTERISLEGELLEKRKLVTALTEQQHAARRKNDADELVKVEAEFVKAGLAVQATTDKLEKVRSRIDKLRVTAPADGVVATFQVRQLLENRPVRRGESLLQILQPEGAWRLELEAPEHRMGHLLKALDQTPDRRLPVEYVLATEVERSYAGSLTRIGTRTDESEEKGAVVQVFADIRRDDLRHANIGAAVIAKIDCGKKSLFYVLFGDVVEFLQRHLWI